MYFVIAVDYKLAKRKQNIEGGLILEVLLDAGVPH
jgi:hypothetical protein